MNVLVRQELKGRQLLAVSVLLLVAGVFNDPPWKWYNRSQGVTLSGEPAHVVASLLRNEGFANPFATIPTGKTAHVAPVFPFVQFLVLRVFGSGPPGWLALRWLPTLALSLQFALLPSLARALGYSPWIGALAAILGLIAKPGKEELWEAHLAGLVCLLLVMSFCRLLKDRSWRLSLATGVLGGALFYCSRFLRSLTSDVCYGSIVLVAIGRNCCRFGCARFSCALRG
jgi:hypothetical protein